MGKSALNFVAGSLQVVVPSKGAFRQPPYVRSKHVVHRSAKLLAFKSCMQQELSGKKTGDRGKVRENFKAAASKCK